MYITFIIFLLSDMFYLLYTVYLSSFSHFTYCILYIFPPFHILWFNDTLTFQIGSFQSEVNREEAYIEGFSLYTVTHLINFNCEKLLMYIEQIYMTLLLNYPAHRYQNYLRNKLFECKEKELKLIDEILQIKGEVEELELELSLPCTSSLIETKK